MPNSSTQTITPTLIFLVGVGSPAFIYTDLVARLQDQIPHSAFHILEWWTYEDFGKNVLKNYIKDTNAILVGHSAGGAMAIQALAEWPDLVNKVVMLDTHRLQSMKPFPPIAKMLEVMLAEDSAEIRKEVERAYAPLIKNGDTFYKAVDFLVDWVANGFDKVASVIQELPSHTVLHLGFTDNHYKILDSKHEKDQQELWGKHNIDIECMPMTHFNLLDSDRAAAITQVVVQWLQQFKS